MTETEERADSPEGPRMIRVLVADDDPLARHAVSVILGAHPGICVAGEAADGLEAEAQLGPARPDVVLLDIRMPVTDGLTALRRIRRVRPDLPVVMLTTFSERDLIVSALSAGAAGFLLKTSAPEELGRAVETAHRGGLVMSAAVTRSVVDDWVAGRTANDDERRRLDALTERQRDVLDAVAEGWSNAEIGRSLHLSEGTVKGYVSDVITSLRVRNRVEAAVLWHRLR